MKSLHNIISNYRSELDSLLKREPLKHPVKHFRTIGDKVVLELKESNIQTVSVNRAVLAGGVPEYANIIALIREAGIAVVEE